MCLAPLLLAGYLFTLYPNHGHVSNLNGTMLEMQTCEQGLGLDLKATTSGLYGIDLQYGFSTTVAGWTLTATPKAGLSYSDVAHPEHQSKGNFSLAFQVLLGRDRWRVSTEYWHLSNAGLGERNAGLDTLAILAGVHF